MQFDLTDFSLISQHLVMTENLNPNHTIFGGQLLAWLDKDLYIYTSTEVKYKSLVTLSINDVRFTKPAKLGEIIQMYGKIHQIKRSSIITMGKAAAFDPETKVKKGIIECEITFVAVDSNGRPKRIFETK